MTRRRPNARRPLGFESLEGRALLATTNVAAAVVGGDLTITGDSQNNTITISQIDADSFYVAGQRIGGPFTSTTTKVNGSTARQQFDGVTGDVIFEMLGGNDSVSISGATLPRDLIGLLGIGNDAVVLRDVTIQRDLDIDMEGGADRFSMGSGSAALSPLIPVVPGAGSEVAGALTVLGSSGNDTLAIGFTTAQQDLEIDAGSGNDTVTVVRCEVVNSILVDAGTENDTVTIQSNVATAVVVALGDGTNTASLLGGIYDSATVTGGINEDTVTCDRLTVVGDVTITTGDRADTVTLKRSQADRFVVDVGDNQRTVGNTVTVTQSVSNWGIFTCIGLHLNSLTIDSLSRIQAIVESGFQIVNM